MPARLCPKHSKPYPCGPCRKESAAKPAQAPQQREIRCSTDGCAEVYVVPVGVILADGFKFTCKSHAPQNERAVARPVPPSAVSSETKAQIAATLASAPLNPIKRGWNGSSTKTLKSLPQPVIPSADPKAPFGHDENDRPIGVPVGKPYVKPVQTGTVEPRPKLCVCGRSLCRYCHPENIAQTEVLKSLTQNYDRVQVKTVDEDSLRRQFGLPTYSTAPKARVTHRFVYYPEVFQLSRTKLLELLDYALETLTTTEVDPSKPKQRVLKSTAPIKTQLAQLKYKEAKAETRIAELNKSTKESQDIIEGLSVRVLKLRRSPDDPLLTDKATREKLKREENVNLEKCEKERRELQKQLRDSGIGVLQARLDKWGSSPEDFDEVPVTVERTITTCTFAEKFIPPDGFDGMLPAGYQYGVEAYRQWVYAYDQNNLTDSKSAVWSGWKQFENEIILQAIGWSLVRPSKKLFATHPSLRCYLPDHSADDESDGAEESALIVKTGGAQINGSVYSFGTTSTDKPRSSGDFDKTIAYGKEPGGIGSRFDEDSEEETDITE
jgi:hypothetical protein